MILVCGAAAVLVASVVAANAVLRPGCSLLPVALPEGNVAVPATSEQVCAALGRPLPETQRLPAGVKPAEVTIDGPEPFDSSRFVYVGYVLSGRHVAVLATRKGGGFGPEMRAQMNATLDGVPALIEQRTIASLGTDDVSYVWERDGLMFTLHVQITDGITRDAADQMAASIR